MRRIVFLCVIAATSFLHSSALLAADRGWDALELQQRRIEPGVKASRGDSRPWPLFRALRSAGFRRGLGAVNRFLEALGRHLAPQERP
jgi:hypothetical protein